MYSPNGGMLNLKRDGTKRVASGGVKDGLPLILTGGRARHDAFHFNFTDPGKFKKKEAWGKAKLRETLKGQPTLPKSEVAEKLKFVIPANFCIDCCRSDRPTDGGFLNLKAIADDEYAGIGLIPGNVVLTVWCQDCFDRDQFSKKNLAICQGDDIPQDVIVPKQIDVPPEEMDEYALNKIRGNRMHRNMIDYLRNQIMARNPTIYVQADDKVGLA
jgi:hypothetical protein